MRSNFILLFPIFIFCLFNSYPYTPFGGNRNCGDFKVSAEIKEACYGSANGSITLQIKGGLPPYQIKWLDGKTGQNIKGLEEGTYSVLVEDSNGCQLKRSLQVTSFDKLTAFIDEASSSGTLEIIVSGGDPPYMYNWIGASGIINSENKTANRITNLSKGKYTVAVTDNNRCTSVFNAAVR